MKKNYFFAAILSLTMMGMNAQLTDDMESYTDGTPILEGHWTSWSGGESDAILSSSDYARSGGLSGYIDGGGVIDGVLDLGNKIFGTWYVNFYVYIPSNQMGYYNTQAETPVLPEWAGEFYFNRDNTMAGIGEVVGTAADAEFDFPHDAWFSVDMAWDISLGLSSATWSMSVDGVEVVPAGTAYLNSDGAAPSGLGGFDFYSAGATNAMYLDDFIYQDTPIIAGAESFEATGFRSALNNNILTLRANEEISNVSIYNMLGQEVYRSSNNTSSIDMSSYANGTYIVKVNIAGTEGTVKIVK